jgi:hypothetical protein
VRHQDHHKEEDSCAEHIVGINSKLHDVYPALEGHALVNGYERIYNVVEIRQPVVQLRDQSVAVQIFF